MRRHLRVFFVAALAAILTALTPSALGAPMTLEGMAGSSANGVVGIPGVAGGVFDPPPAGSISKSSGIGDGVDHFGSANFFGNTGGQFAVSAEGMGTWTADTEFHQSTTLTNTTGAAVSVTFSAEILAGGLAVAANQDSMSSYSMSISAGGVVLQASSGELTSLGGTVALSVTNPFASANPWTPGTAGYSWGDTTSFFDLGLLADGDSITVDYDIAVHSEGTFDPTCDPTDFSGAAGPGLRLNSACAGAALFGDPFGLAGQPIPTSSQFVLTPVPAPTPAALLLILMVAWRARKWLG